MIDEEALRSARANGVLDVRGVTFTAEMVDQLKSAVPGTDEPAWTLLCDEAAFPDNVSFRGMRFGDRSRFVRTQFGTGTNFKGTVFGDDNDFSRAQFGDACYFRYTRFGLYANFTSAIFGKSVIFTDTVRFDDRLIFRSAVFGDDLNFEKVLFEGMSDLTDVTFGARAKLNIFSRGAAFFTRSTFGRLVDLRFAGPDLDLEGADLSEGGSIRAWGTGIDLRQAKFDAPFLITQRAPVAEPVPGKVNLGADPEGFAALSAKPRLVSCDESNVRNLVLDQVDLSECEFGRAHNLDELRIGRSDQFLLSPRRRRRILHEEHVWLTGDEQSRVQARQVEQTYRSLRKGFEDRKNAPGAADFYYGEMEMRRRGTESSAERFLLWGYWLLSGYGLRAWRALATLAVVLLTGAVLFRTVGFTNPAGWSEVVFTTAQSATSLVRPTTSPPFTTAGRYVDMALRILCPLLLALALLAVRARVKR